MPQAQAYASEPVQIAEILGLPKASTYDHLKLVDVIQRGVPAASVRHAVKAIDPEGSQLLAEHLVPRSTLHRTAGKQKPLSTDASETLWQVARVFVEARRLYGDDAAALAFLMRSHPLLDGRRPFDLARETAAGADLVLERLAQAEAGVAV